MNWITLFYSGGIALVLSWATTGCRLGNHVESQSNPDTLTGYYEMAPQSLEFCANTSATQCKPAPSTEIPAIFSEVYSNPVALIMMDLASGAARIYSLTVEDAAIDILVQPNKTLSFMGASRTSGFYDSVECTTQITVNETGRLNLEEGPFTTGFPKHLSGRIQLEVMAVQKFTGDCNASMTAAYECYTDPDAALEKCMGSTLKDRQAAREYLEEFFGPYIKAEAMRIEDIPLLTSLAYTIQYQ